MPKSVEEEPHSATSPCIQNDEEVKGEARNYDGIEQEENELSQNKKPSPLKILARPPTLGYSVLRDDNDNASEQGVSMNLLMPQAAEYSAVRH